VDHRAPTTPTAPPATVALDALASELRALYTERFRLALRAAEAAERRFETPDGTSSIDPVYAADTTACRAVNRHLPVAIGRWLPGARQLGQTTEPAIVESQWLHQDRVIAIDCDYRHDFGDPQAITVREVAR